MTISRGIKKIPKISNFRQVIICSQQKVFMLTLQSLAYTVRRERTDGCIWSFATANPDSCESRSV